MEKPHLARDLMIGRPVTLSPRTSVFDGVELLLSRGVSGAPVIDGKGQYQGIFSERCAIRVLVEEARLANEAGEALGKGVEARDFMPARLHSFKRDDDAFDAVSTLLRLRVSGAPVLDEKGRFLGVFSERYAMSLLVQSLMEGLPSGPVARFMNTDRGRNLPADTDLLTVARMFLDRYYRRLCLEQGEEVVGLISRRDVLRAMEGELPALAGSSFPDGKVTRIPAATVADFMDIAASTIDEELDLLGIAQIFFNTNYRRLPVLREGKLVGQISRRDLLAATQKLLEPTSSHAPGTLYLSAVRGPDESPPIG